MTLKIKRWTGLGLGTAFLGTTLAACSNPADGSPIDVPAVEQNQLAHTISTEVGEMGETGEGGEEGHHVDALPREHRLAFMMGHVKAGLALYRAGELEMAAPHLLHPVSETHISEREGLDELGFDAELFEAVSRALENGTAAAKIEPQLKAAEANLRLVSQKAGGDTAGIIRFLMETVVEEYTIALTDGVVTDAGEYQDAYGFAIVAKQKANELAGNTGVISKLDELIEMWPLQGPVPPAIPSPIAQVTAKASEVQLLLPSDL